MNKSKLFLVLFLITILMAGPFIIIKSATKENKEVNTENIENKTHEETEIKKEENMENKVQEEIKNKESNKNTNVTKDYFNDALFIGDSRTVGIMEYGNLNNASFFANDGLSVYNVREKVVSSPKTGKLKLDELLTNKKFGKIYVMLGINELGYNLNQTVKKYSDLIESISQKQPASIIYIEANLHVTSKKSNSDNIFNNKNIDTFNNAIKKLADNKKIFYIDINEKFNDGKGNLAAEYTSDQVHIYAKYYKEWSDWIIKNTKGEE